MGLLSKLNKEVDGENVQGGDEDTLGGFIIDSDAYKFTVEVAYETTATSGASGIVLKSVGKPIDGGKKVNFNTTLWTTGRNGKPYWERDGKKNFLPGYIIATSLAELTESGDLDTEEAVIPVYNAEHKKEIPTKVQMITELIGKQFVGGVIKKLVDKTIKDNTGAYVPTGETREENELSKVFSADGLTLTELKAGLDSPDFLNKWLDKYKGTVPNKAKHSNKAKAGGQQQQAMPAAAPSSGMFKDED